MTPAPEVPHSLHPLGEPARAVGAWNVANVLTVTRLCLVPVFAVLLLAAPGDGSRLAAFAVFVVAAVTDLVDGDLARRRGLVTDVGKILDPIADKALIGTALVGLSWLGELGWGVTVVIVVREIGVTLLRFWVLRHGVLAASRGGKLKTVLQGVAIGLYVLPLSGVWAALAATVMTAAVVITLVTGADYVLRALRLRRTAGLAPDVPADAAADVPADVPAGGARAREGTGADEAAPARRPA